MGIWKSVSRAKRFGSVYILLILCLILTTGVFTDSAGAASSCDVDLTDRSAPDISQCNFRVTSFTQKEVRLAWSQARDDESIVGYRLVRNGVEIAQLPFKTTSYIDKIGLSSGQFYYYELIAYDEAGNKSSAAVWAATAGLIDTQKPDTVTGLKLTDRGPNWVKLAWNSTSDTSPAGRVEVKGYLIYRDGAPISYLWATTSPFYPSFKDEHSLMDGTKYIYEVSALDGAGNKGSRSNKIEVTTIDGTAPGYPYGLQKSILSVNSVKLTWTAPRDNVGVTGYKIYRNQTLLPQTTTATSYTDTGLLPAITYFYTIIAYDAAGNESVQSWPLEVKTDTTSPAAPVLTAEVLSDSQIKISWNAITDNTPIKSYVIWRDNGKFYAKIGTTTGTTYVDPDTFYIDSGLNPDTTYDYMVNAYDSGDNEGEAAYIEATTKPDITRPATPVVTAKAVSCSQIDLTWQAEQGVAYYYIYRNGNEDHIARTGNAASYADKNLNANTEYSYQVLASDYSGNNSLRSAEAKAKTFPDAEPPSSAPVLTAVAVSGTEVALSWTEPDDNGVITIYRIYRDGASLGSWGAPGIYYTLDKNLRPGQTYVYTINAYDSAGNPGPMSKPTTVTTPASEFIQPQISAGSLHTAVLRKDGTVTAVGQNNYNECNVGDWSNIIQVAAGWIYTIGLKKDGTVVAAGLKYSFSNANDHVNRWSNIVQVAAGGQHTVGLKKDCTVIAAGTNNYGQCTFDQNWNNITQIAAGMSHTLGLKRDGTVIAVGRPDEGQCTFNQDWNNIVQIAAGDYHSVGLKSDGTVVVAGSIDADQLNDINNWTDIIQIACGCYYTIGLKSNGTVVVASEHRPSAKFNVGTWANIIQIAAGLNQTIGLQKDGTVVAVGDNYYGQINVADIDTSAAPITSQVAAGAIHTVGLKSDGTVVAVGGNLYGQTIVKEWNTGKRLKQIAAGAYHTVGLKVDGTVKAIGNAEAYSDKSGHHVHQWTDIKQVAAGGTHTVGLKSDGTVVALGDTSQGQCAVTGSGWTDIVQIAAGYNCTVGLKNNGDVVATGWLSEDVLEQANIKQVAAGYDYIIGQGTYYPFFLGRDHGGSPGDRGKVSDVGDWSNIKYIACGWFHAVGITIEDKVLAVGANNFHQCEVAGSDWSDIVQVTAGNGHTIGLKSNGKVVAAGNNSADDRCNVGNWDLHGPQAPSDLQVTTQADLSWKAPADGADVKGYNIYRGAEKIGSTIGTSYSDMGLADQTTYTYRVKAYDAAGNESLPAAQAVITDLGPLAGSQVQRAQAVSSARINLSWDYMGLNLKRVAGYYIYRSDGSKTVKIKTTRQTCYIDQDLQPGTKYGYSVTAYDVAGNEGPRNAYIYETTPEAPNPLLARPVIAAGMHETVGLKAYGGIILTGYLNNNPTWKDMDIVQLAAGVFFVAGLKTDGTIISYPVIDEFRDWTDVVQISTFEYNLAGLKKGGTAYNTLNDVKNWTDIAQVAAGGRHTVGLKKDGTVVAVGNNDYGQCNVGDWKHIIQISAGYYHTVGLTIEGQVVAVGDIRDGQCNVNTEKWVDIKQISAGWFHTLGLKGNGKVVATECSQDNRCNVGSWEDVRMIAGGRTHSVGLTNNGRMLAVGVNINGIYGECNVSSFNLFPPAGTDNLKVTAVSGGKVDLSWDAAAPGIEQGAEVKGYYVYRTELKQGIVKFTVKFKATQNTYTDTSVIPGAKYIYQVGTFDEDGNESISKSNKLEVNTLPAYTISGAVQNGTGRLAGVVMQGLPGNPATDSSGAYKVTVVQGWQGTVTPTLAGYAFIPANRAFTNVMADQIVYFTAVEATPPTVAITAPENGSKVAGMVTIIAEAADNDKVIGVKFFIDGTQLGSEDPEPPYSVVWDAGKFINGTHTLTAEARDAAGNKKTSAPVVVSNDAVLPTVSITAPKANATLSGTVTVTATATDNDKMAGVQFFMDGMALGAEDTVSPYSISWDTRRTLNGTHKLTAEARDVSGNRKTSAAVSVTVKQKAVIFGFKAEPTEIYAGKNCTLTWDAPNATSLSINQGVGTVTGTNKSVSPTATTTYTLTAKNDVGTSTANVTVTVKIDPTIPSTPGNVKTFVTSTNQVALGWDASQDDGYIMGYNIYRTDASGKTVRVDSTPNLVYFDIDLTPGATYIYNVSAFDDTDKESSRSADKKATLPTTQLAAGYEFSVGLKKNGTVTAAGANVNAYGIEGSKWSNIIQIAAGGFHAVGLKNHTVMAVGYEGSFSNGDVDHVTNWTDMVQIAAGGYHTVGLNKYGQVRALGDNSVRQCEVDNWTEIAQIAAQGEITLGLWHDGTVVATGRDRDDQFEGLNRWNNIVQLSTGGDHTVGLKKDGTVVAVGNDDWSQCSGTANWTDIVQVAAGSGYTVGLTSGGKVLAVGYNEDGRCDINNQTGFAQLPAAYYYHTVALKTGGTVAFYGNTDFGKGEAALWNLNDITGPGTPSLIAGAKTDTTLTFSWKAVSDNTGGSGLKGYAIYRNGILIDATDKPTYTDKYLRPSSTFKYAVIAYDNTANLSAQSNTLSMTTTAPAYASMVAAGEGHTVGLKKDGTVLAVGDNTAGTGQCNVDAWSKNKDIVQVAAGEVHTVGLKKDGTVVATGDNESGKCSFNADEWQNIVRIAAGAFHTVGLKKDGTVLAVGDGYYGQCSVDYWNDHYKDILQVAAGSLHTVALRENGRVAAVGAGEAYGNDNGSVFDWTDIVQIAAGSYHTVGLTRNGTVVATGSYEAGQCNVFEWTDIVQIWAGGDLTVGLKSDGTIVAAGWSGILGCDYDPDGTCMQSVIDSLNADKDIMQFSSFGNHAVFLKKTNGKVVAKGNNDSEQCNVSGWKLN